uniref:F-box domain-containing protein n=1 Tax=Leersia perrieri TaxID=77586 RepID=A0A0D9WPJ0_9ORYZ
MSSQLGSRRRRMFSDGRHRIQRCTNLAVLSRNHAMEMIATKDKNTLDCNSEEPPMLKTYKRRRVRRDPSIPDELVYEILLRLPVKTLVRSKCVCKAWQATISKPSFICAHLKQQQSATCRHVQKPSFLITPHTLDSIIDDEVWPSTFSNSIPFYHWQEGQDNACLVHAMDFHGEFRSVYRMSHCDGLVMLPTNTKLYVFNPATCDFLKLPDGQKDHLGIQTAGLGLDLGTNTYKVVRSFYRSVDFRRRTYDVGIEVFAIGGHDSCWRRVVEDPPYPVSIQDPIYFKGSMYWHICKKLIRNPPQGFICFSLQDETFSLIRHTISSSDDEGIRLHFVELGGELCVAQYLATQIVVWKSSMSSDSHQWDRLYSISNLTNEAWKFQPFLDLVDDFMLLGPSNCIYLYNKASRSTKELVFVDQLKYTNPKVGKLDFVRKDFYFFNIVPYIESLVPLRAPMEQRESGRVVED